MVGDKIIIFGYSNIGSQIAAVMKQKKYTILIVEKDEKLYKDAIADGYETLNLSLMDDEELLQIGIQEDNLKAFFCVSNENNINLFVTLSARNLNKDLKIISLAFAKEDNKKMLLAGANKIINPYEIGGMRIFRLLHKPLILDILDNILFSESDIEVSEITIEDGSILDKQYLKDLDIDIKYNLVILGIQDKELGEEFIFYSSGINHKIDVGDTLVVIGYSQDLRMFQHYAKPHKN